MREMNAAWLYFVAAFALGFGLLEWWGWARYGEPGTLSAHVRTWSYYHPLVPFCLGLLIGGLAIHFWAVGSSPAN